MKKISYLLITALVVILRLGAVPLSAEEAQSVDDAVLSQVEQLENLRDSNPEAYRQWVGERKAELRQKFQQMDGGRQARFKKFVSGRQGLRQERLKHFRERQPQAFERFKNQRMRRWQAMAQKNPRIKEKPENSGARNDFQRRQIQKQGAQPAGSRAGLNRSAETRRQQMGPRGAGRPGISRAGGPRGGRRR